MTLPQHDQADAPGSGLRVSESWQSGLLSLTVVLALLFMVLWAAVYYNGAGISILVYAGWTLVALGLALRLLAHREQQLGPEDGEGSPHERYLATTGLHAVVRYPARLGGILAICGLILITQHWLGLVIGILAILAIYAGTSLSDRTGPASFGPGYAAYRDSVPALNIFSGLRRRFRES